MENSDINNNVVNNVNVVDEKIESESKRASEEIRKSLKDRNKMPKFRVGRKLLYAKV